MPRVGDITFVPSTSNGLGGLLPLDQIPDDIKAEVEEIYAGLKTNPNGRMRVEFDTKGELAQYVLQVTSYCKQRTDPQTGEVVEYRFRKSPTKGLKDTQMDFRVTDPKTDEEETTENTPQASPPEAPVKATKTAGRK